MNSGSAGSDLPSAESILEADEQLLQRLQRLTAQLADRMIRRHGEDDRSVWGRAEAEIFGASPDAQD
jgi:hypothetical protein